MTKKIYMVGASMETTSLGIYAKYLEAALIKKGFLVYEKRRIISKEDSLFKWLFKYIVYGMGLVFKYSSNDDIVIYTHNICFFPPLFFPKNRIIIVHDFFYYDKDFYLNKKGIAKRMYYYYNSIHKWRFKLTFKRTTKIIAISQAAKNEIIDKFGSSFADKIEVIHNGMDTSAFKPLPKKIKRSDQEKYLLYVGSELGRKNLKNIIAAFALVHKEFPNLKLIKAPCEGVAEYRNQTLQAIKDNHLEVGKQVILVDEYLPLEKLVELYQNAEIFLFPTLKEGFGFPIIEAQACGVPVITTNYEPMLELVPYKEMTVDPHSPQDIAEKIIKILKNPALKEQMVHDGLDYVKQFSWEKTAEKFKEVLGRL